MTNRKQDTKYHEVLKQAAIYSYHKPGNYPPSGYRVIDFDENKKTGFYADVLSNGNDIIIAYRGTESGQDIRNDVAMAKSKIPAQTIDAIRIYDKVKREYPNADIVVTGHSLGGSLAEIVSGIRGNLAVTFNAYGVGDMFRERNILKENNIVNYVNEYDAVSMVNGQNHIGEIFAVSNDCNNKLGNHKAENMGDLSKRVQKTPEEIKETAQRIHPKSLWLKTTIWGEPKEPKTYEYRNSELHSNQKVTPCVGSYQVSGYTRSDGVKVDDYIRRCGAKHGR
ncbi:DUF2974 domain-containing protein [bacterium]|nr:DUF2974 domain-containing protein [bacterium]